VISVYAPPLVSALSGTTVRQLQYWRKTDVLAPEHWAPTQVLYSFPDLIALRTFGYLRGEYSLQQIRKALSNFRGLRPTGHLSNFKIVGSGNSILWVDGNSATDILRRPGQILIAEMVDVLAAFTSKAGRDIVPLERPEKGIRIDAGIRGGYPVIEGTRVPFDAVASLLRDGIPAKKVSEFYPAVGTMAANGALRLADYVDDYARATAA